MRDNTYIINQLLQDEGLRLRPYKDTVGKLTIGVGRNLDDRGISKAEAMMMLNNDIAAFITDLDNTLPWWNNLDPARQDVLLNMCFNLGLGGLLTFKNTLFMIEQGKYAEAAEAMMKSKWAEQVGARAVRLSNIMRGTP